MQIFKTLKTYIINLGLEPLLLMIVLLDMNIASNSRLPWPKSKVHTILSYALQPTLIGIVF